MDRSDIEKIKVGSIIVFNSSKYLITQVMIHYKENLNQSMIGFTKLGPNGEQIGTGNLVYQWNDIVNEVGEINGKAREIF